MKKYEQIYNDLVDSIGKGELNAGANPITENMLCRTYGVSRTTARHALQMLHKEGFIYRKTKLGTFVASFEQDKKKIAIVLPFEESTNYRFMDAVIDCNSQFNYKIDVYRTKMNMITEISVMEQINAGNYNGVIFYPFIDCVPLDSLSRLIIKHLPIVLVDTTVVGVNLPTVQSDNIKAFYDLVSFFIKRGARRIAFSSMVGHLSLANRQRYEGYIQAHTDNSLPVDSSLVFQTKYFDRDYYNLSFEMQLRENRQHSQEIYRLYASLQYKPDVICFVNDMSAADFILYCDEIGVNIKKEVIISGFDNLDISKTLCFTTVQQNFYSIGKNALLQLSKQINHERGKRDILVPTKVICREK